jgi:hypothetical protein
MNKTAQEAREMAKHWEAYGLGKFRGEHLDEILVKCAEEIERLEGVVKKLSSKFNTQEQSIDFLKNAVYQHGKITK